MQTERRFLQKLFSFFLGYEPCIRRNSRLEKDIKELKRRENFDAENF